MKLLDAGVIYTFPKKCLPLQKVKIVFEWNGLKGQKVNFEIFDGNHQIYLKKQVKSKKKKAELTIQAGSVPGVHYIKAEIISKDNKSKYFRWGSFLVEIKTFLFTDDKKINGLFQLLKEGVELSIDKFKVNGFPVTYCKTGDNSWENIAYPAYGISAMKYFIEDIKSMFEVLYEYQWPEGKLPDHIYGDNHPDYTNSKLRKLRSIMADIEPVSVINVYESWQVHGDTQWLKSLLPKIEKSLFYLKKDPFMWDKKYNLLKRPHTCDMWDVQIIENSCFFTPNSRFVIMTGDICAMFKACEILSKIYNLFNNKKKMKFWEEQKKYFYEKGNKIFWDGKKYKHHIHLDTIDHKDFNEDEQLALSNVYTITRNFADHKKSVLIIREYFERWKKTKSKFPWWSLQPGYPDKLKYFKTTYPWRKKQGEYCNGGLFPLVGGELSKGCFQHGFEKGGFKLLYDFYSLIKKYYGAVFTWYYSDGTPGIVAPHHQTNYDLWGITPWLQSLIEEAGGIKSIGKTFEETLCSPKWAASKIKNCYLIAYFPSSNTYFSYNYRIRKNFIEILYTGTGEKVNFHILLPKDKKCKKCLLNGKKIKFDIEKVESSEYINFQTALKGINKVKIIF